MKEKAETLNYIIIRSLSMTNWLCLHGHRIIKVSDSEKDSKFKVFLFHDTDALRKTMSEFKEGV